jgi:hypothetical protein
MSVIFFEIEEIVTKGIDVTTVDFKSKVNAFIPSELQGEGAAQAGKFQLSVNDDVKKQFRL